MTHKDELLAWFKRGLTITPAEAVERWDNYRLADTVYNLRQDGHMIHTETMERINDDGRRITWARYHYISGPRGEQADSAGDMPSQSHPAPAERQGSFMQRLRGALRYNSGE